MLFLLCDCSCKFSQVALATVLSAANTANLSAQVICYVQCTVLCAISMCAMCYVLMCDVVCFVQRALCMHNALCSVDVVWQLGLEALIQGQTRCGAMLVHENDR